MPKNPISVLRLNNNDRFWYYELNMKQFLRALENFLNKINNWRDAVSFIFIRRYWPSYISPNHLSYFRVVIGGLLFFLLFFLNIEYKPIIISLFAIGALSDLIDGSLARTTNQVTEFGGVLDPTADRMLIIPIAFYSLMDAYPWLLTALIITEIINALFSWYYNTKEIYLESNILGKTKMFCLCIVFFVILWTFPHHPPLFFIYLLWLTIPLSFLSIFSKILELDSEKTWR